MGLILKAAGANFEANAVSYIPPVADGLLYWGFLNDSIEKLGRNFAPGGGPLSVVGAPIMDAKGAVLSASNYVQLPVQQTPSLTIIVVGHPCYAPTTALRALEVLLASHRVSPCTPPLTPLVSSGL